MNKILGVLIVTLVLMGTAFAAVDVTANVGNGVPVIDGTTMQICNGSCATDLNIDPATAFTIKVTITDPNGQADLNLSTLKLGFGNPGAIYGEANTWDSIILGEITIPTAAHGTRDGCTESGTTYCLNVDANQWTTKFKAGAFTWAIDVNDNSGGKATQKYTTTQLLFVNGVVGHSEDATSMSYTGNPDTNNNAMLSNTAKAYIITTHTGNVTMILKVSGTALDDSVHTPIAVGKQKFNGTDDSATATALTGSAAQCAPPLARGTYPTSTTQNLYWWLDIPAGQGSGAYTGTITYATIAQ
jgi:hypothetical protein